VITWPDANERKEISKRFMAEYGWPNLVGVTDGSLLPLAFRPETDDAPDYKGRKHGYSLTSLFIFDDCRRVRFYLTGWPGTAHDNRVFENTPLVSHPHSYFSDQEYIIGDSAYQCFWFMVSAYRKPQGAVLPREHEVFNDALKQPRVIAEHGIGILKGRFPYLRQLRHKIKRTHTRRSMKRILTYIQAAVVLHNLLVELNDEGDEDWMDLDDISDIEDYCGLDDYHGINSPILMYEPSDERRRRLTAFFNEAHIM
jgi:hypothetical protein